MEKSHYRIDEVQFIPQEKSLVFNRYRSVKLTSREAQILQYMLDNPNQATTLSEIIQKSLSDYPTDPVATRKIIQVLSTKLELADHIEYPYVDCYMFSCHDPSDKKPSLFSFKGLKRWLKGNPEVARVAV